MKKISFVLLMLLFSVTTFAQRGKDWKGKSHEERAAMYVDRMDRRLNLSSEQKEQIKEMQMKRLQTQQEMMASHQNMNQNASDMAAARQEMQQQRMQMHENFKAQMKDILDEKQYAKWEAMDKKDWERKQQMQNGDMMKNKKNYNDDQEDDDEDD